MTRGTNLVKKFKEQATETNQSIFIGKVWAGEGSGKYQVGSMGIWLYSRGEPTKVRPPVAEAATLDALYGRS